MICGLFLSGCAGSPSEAAPTFVPPTAAAGSPATAFLTRPTYEITAGTLTDAVTVRGDLVATRQAELFLPLGGTVRAVHVEPGAEVAEGETLAELAAASQQQTLLQRESALTIAELQLAKLEANENANAFDLRIQREQVALAEALYELAQQQYAETVLTAPFAGTVTMFSLDQGSRVDAYQTVCVVADLSEVEVRGTLPAALRDRVSAGQAVQVRIDGYGSATFAGTVAEIADEAATWQGELAYALVVALDAGQDMPAIAQVGADVVIVGETRAEVPWAPENALIALGGETYVDRLTESGIERTPVTTGIVEGQRVEIVDGVAVGDTVVLP
jgi:membrane fusion protein, multidrug efflux system